MAVQAVALVVPLVIQTRFVIFFPFATVARGLCGRDWKNCEAVFQHCEQNVKGTAFCAFDIRSDSVVLESLVLHSKSHPYKNTPFTFVQ